MYVLFPTPSWSAPGISRWAYKTWGVNRAYWYIPWVLVYRVTMELQWGPQTGAEQIVLAESTLWLITCNNKPVLLCVTVWCWWV